MRGPCQRFGGAFAARPATFPTLRVEQVLSQLGAGLRQALLAVRALGSFTALSGPIILAGAVTSSQLRRMRETALLKLLGLTRAQLVSLLAVEYARSGAVAGTLGERLAPTCWRRSSCVSCSR